MALTQSTRIATLNTPLGGDTLVFHSLSISEELGRLFSLDIEAGSERGDLKADDLLGKGVSVEMQCPRGGVRYFHGFVSRFSRIPRPGTRYFAYRLTAVPWLWFLTLHSDCLIFQNKTLQDIVRDVFGRRGFSDFKFQLSGDYTPWEYCVQYRETDFNFVSRLLEQEGVYYYFEHEKEKHTAVFVDSPAAHQPFPKYEKLTFSALTSRHEHDQEHVYDWVHEGRHHSGKYQQTDYDFTKPTADLKTPESNPGNFALSEFEIFDYPGEYDKRSDGEQWSRVRMEELRADRETFQGGGDVTGLATGHKFTLSQGPSPADTGEYLVIASSIELQSNIYESGTSGGMGESYHCTFTAIKAADQFRPARLTPKPVIQGVQTAVVSGPKGEEIYTDKYGCVKVQFHWDRYGKADENSSCWVRISQTWAGKGWGAISIPRIGQEVIVEFLEGDPDRPIVTGRVYNAINTTPYELPGFKTITGFKSDSSKGSRGHNELRFEDKKGAEQVVVHSQGRMDICVNSIFCETNGSDRNLHVGCDWSIKVKNDLLEWIVGGFYEEIDKDYNVKIAGKVLQAFEQTYTLGVEAAIQVTAQKLLLAVQESINVQSPKITVEAPNSLSMRGGEAILEGGKDGLMLRCGDNFIKITSDEIKINGMAVKMVGAKVDIEGEMIKLGPGGPAGEGPAGRNTPDAAKEDGQLPDDPAGCSCGPPGQGGGGGGGGGGGWGQKHKRTFSVDPAPIPHWVPPPPPKQPIIPPVGTDENKEPCEIKDLTVQCEHKDRTADPSSHMLQIVPSTNALSDTVSYTIDSIKCKVSAKRTKGGTDTLKLKATSIDGKDADLKTAVLRTATPPTKGDYKGGPTQSFIVTSPACSDLWPYPFTPESYFLYGLGCKDNATPASATVEAYASIAYSGNIECTKFEDLFKKHASTDQKFGFKASVDVAGPKGTIKVEWGWEENSDWRACFSVSGKASVTFVTVTGKGQCNLRDILIAVGLEFVGVPMNASLELLDAVDAALDKIDESGLIKRKDIDEAFGVIMLTVGVELSIGLEGAYKKKFFPSGGSEASPSVALKGGGKIFAELKMIKSTLQIITVGLTGRGEGPFEATGDLSIEADGLYMSPALDFKGADVTVELTFRVLGRAEFKEELLKWHLMDPKRIYPDPSDPSPAKWKLIPP